MLWLRRTLTEMGGVGDVGGCIASQTSDHAVDDGYSISIYDTTAAPSCRLWVQGGGRLEPPHVRPWAARARQGWTSWPRQPVPKPLT